MQATIKIADMFEEVDRNVPRVPISCASNKFIPHVAELVLQFRKRLLDTDLRD
jgi:hypothetical protein